MSGQSNLVHPRDEIMRTMERIYRYRMTTTSGGNLSIRADDGDLWITPARVDKGSLTRDDIIRIRPDATVDGRHRPSSEFPFHRAIYAARPDLGGIVHAHPVALVAFSICRRAPDTRLLSQVRRVCGDPGFAPYALPGSEALGRNIAAAFAAGSHCVVLENHGVAVGGQSLQNAFQKFETLEFTAKTLVKARLLGEVRYLSEEELELRNQVPPLEEFEPGAPSSGECELRRQLVDFTRRGYQQRLFISTGGSFSARVDEDSFLITPSQVDRHVLDVGDLVLVRGGRAEAGKRASRAARNHQAIYERHPQVGAVLNASPVNVTAFSVTRAPWTRARSRRATCSCATWRASPTACSSATPRGWRGGSPCARPSRCLRTTACSSSARTCSKPSTVWRCLSQPPRPSSTAASSARSRRCRTRSSTTSSAPSRRCSPEGEGDG